MTTALRIFNTLTKQKEVFTPQDPDHVTLYVCGPTVYNYAHVGNARPVVVFDLLVRLLRHDYKRVTYARNITDIDDKIIEASQQSGLPISDITEKYTRIYEEDMGQLNAKLPDIRPKATDYIDQMIAMTADLIDKGHAYEKDGHVLFSVPSMANYGELSGRKLEDMIAGARVDVADYKKDAADFILWKPSSEEQPGWDSPWGRGRPGWHLECSCMIEDNFGKTLDIHGGGLDLIFPHHENEIAQSRCAYDGAPLANYWMHNGYLTVDGEKMSKSLGNFVTVHDLLEEIGRKAGEAIRLQLLSAHYRQPVDFNREGLVAAQKQLDNWYDLTKDIEISDDDISVEFLNALRDDLNTPKAISILHKIRNKIAHSLENVEVLQRQLKSSAQLLGLLEMDYRKWSKGRQTVTKHMDFSWKNLPSDDEIDNKIKERDEAKSNKDYVKADEIRNWLNELDVILKDGANGTKWERK